MTNFVDLMKSDLEEAYQRFVRAFDGVTKEEANAFPVANLSSQIKSMTWLAWHTARELDFQIAFLAKEEPLWHREKWEEKFPFNVADNEADWKHSLAEAQRIWVDDTSILLAYLKAAKDYAKEYIDHVNESQLDDIVDKSWTPVVTRGVRLVSIIDDASMHSGQVFYARRLLGLKD